MNSKNGMYIVLLMKVVLIFALLATSANANPVNPANPRNFQSLHNSPLVDRFQHDQPVMKFGEKNQPMVTANVPTPIASEKTAIEENAGGNESSGLQSAIEAAHQPPSVLTLSGLTPTTEEEYISNSNTSAVKANVSMPIAAETAVEPKSRLGSMNSATAVMANVSMPIEAVETTVEPKSRLGSMNSISLEQTIAVSNNVAPIDLVSLLAVVNLSISGTVFDDLNSDGLRTTDEPGHAGWGIVLKLNGKTVGQTTSNDAGQYSFDNLPPGKYTLMENKQAGWNQTHPASESFDVNLIDKDAINYNFGNHYGPVDLGATKHLTQPPIISTNAWLMHSRGIAALSQKAAITSPSLLRFLTTAKYPKSMSLLSFVPYIPSERDQGSCGDCWVWGCTVPIEIAHRIQNGISDRLSIQFVNSNYRGDSGSSACCGGWEGSFADFYSAQGKVIPWSNTNANFRDAAQYCSDSSSVSSSVISTVPYYPITSIQWHLIPTRGSGIDQDQAINLIKALLNVNKAVTLGFYLPDFTPFLSFWGTDSGIWNPDPYSGLPAGKYPGGHEVTIVGYNDSNSSNRYWIALNSWGTNKAHPDGTFKLKMDMLYNCSNDGYSSADFGYFDVVFGGNTPPTTPSVPVGINSTAVGTTCGYSMSSNDQEGDQLSYTFDWGDGSSIATSLINSGMVVSEFHTWTKAGTFQVKAMATDSKGATSGWSNGLTVTVGSPGSDQVSPTDLNQTFPQVPDLRINQTTVR